ncbi:non-structural maintenance of chromosomes element 3 homolog [Megalopta genalis]|uniref:non-structural maintenance of chromosomes element 3 homolog n=1 Tax=Megalopta genalis TaxID=115081 RepID=UPI003FD26005
MVFPRNKSGSSKERFLSQPSGSRRKRDINYELESLSQPVPSTSTRRSSPIRMVSDEDGRLTNNLIKYMLVLDRKKQVINKARIVKNVLGGQGKEFTHVISKAKYLLSKVFGYNLVELESNKYILVNELENSLPHIRRQGADASQQVLLFLVLTHVFMNDDYCTQESLLNFLQHLGITSESDEEHSYFGYVKHTVIEVFVAQKYLDKVEETNEKVVVQYKWGPRAEHEFSRRAALEFVSEIYKGRPLDSWPLQFKAMSAREKSIARIKRIGDE